VTKHRGIQRPDVGAKRPDESSAHKGEIEMPELNAIVTRSADEYLAYLRRLEIEARNAKLRVEILQYAFRNSLRHGNHI